MRARRVLLVAAATGMWIVTGPVPAAADDDNDNDNDTSTVAVTVTGGELQISVKSAARDFGTVENTPDGTEITGRLGLVTVRDDRNLAAGSGWVATAIATELVPKQGPGIAPSNIRYSAGSIDKEGTVTVDSGDSVPLDRTRAVVTASKASGNNSANWTPTITITIPAEIPAGTYTGTISHSVS